MDGIGSSNVLMRDTVDKSAVQILQDDIVAYLHPMFPYLTESMIRDSVIRQNKLLADPLDQNRLTNSCIDELLNPDIFMSSAETRTVVSESYIDLTEGSPVYMKTNKTEGFTDFNMMPEVFEFNPVKENTDVNRNVKNKPLSDLNWNNSGQLASDRVTGSDLKPESTKVPSVNIQTAESGLSMKESGIGTDSSVVASQKPSVNISDVTFEATGAPVSWETASKQRSPPKLDVFATSSAGQKFPSNETGATNHRKNPSQAPSTMSRCPCGDCHAHSSPSSWQKSETNLGHVQPHRTVSSYQGLESPLATTQGDGQTGSSSSSGQTNSTSVTQSHDARHTCTTSTGTKAEEICLPVNEMIEIKSDALKAKEKQQDSANVTANIPVQDVTKQTSAKPHPKSSELIDSFWTALMEKASSKSSPTKPGATPTSFSGLQSTRTSSLASPAVTKTQARNDYQGASTCTSSSRPVESQSRPGTISQPSTSATGARSSHQHNYTSRKSNQTCHQRLYKKSISTLTKPAASSFNSTLPAKPASSLPSRSIPPAFGVPRTKHQSSSFQINVQTRAPAKKSMLPAKPGSSFPSQSIQPAVGVPRTKNQSSSFNVQTRAPVKKPTLSTTQAQAVASHQISSGPTFQKSEAHPGSSNSLPVQKPKIKTATTQADSLLNVFSKLPPKSPNSLLSALSVRSGAVTTVPEPRPQLDNQAAPGHPAPFMPNPQPPMVTQPVANPLAAVTIQQPPIKIPDPVAQGNPAPTNWPYPQPQLVTQSVANPRPAIITQPPRIEIPNPFSLDIPAPANWLFGPQITQQPRIAFLNPVAAGQVAPHNEPHTWPQQVGQPVTNPMPVPPITAYPAQIQAPNPAAHGGNPLFQVANPEPQPVIPLPPLDLIYQPPQVIPAQEYQPGNGKSIEEMKAEVLVLFPEADPAYVLTQLEAMKDYPTPINQVCNQLLENPNYPRAKKQEASAKSTKTNAEGEKVDYVKDYYKIQVPRYSEDVILQLQNDFRMLSMETIKTVWSLHFYHYAPTRVCLEEILRTNPDIQNLLPRVKSAQHHQRKVNVQITIKDAQGKEIHSDVMIHLLKGLRQSFYQGNVKTSPELKRQMDFYQQYVKNSALEKDLLLALSMNENEYEAEGQLIECGCCYAEVTFEKMIQCLDGHLFCESCLQMYAKQAVYGQGKAHLTCMTDGCDSSYPRDQLEKVLTTTDMAKFDERVQEESIQLASMEGLVRCPHCDFAAVLDPGDKVFSCQNAGCLKETCRHCGEDWKDHFGKRCEEIEKKSETDMRLSYEERMSQAQIRTCHRCKTGIMKDQGCNKMTCRCGGKMCYICRTPNIDYHHFCGHARNPGQACTVCVKCSLWTDPAEDDARAVKELEKELQVENEKIKRAKDSRERLGPGELAPEAKKQRVV